MIIHTFFVEHKIFYILLLKDSMGSRFHKLFKVTLFPPRFLVNMVKMLARKSLAFDQNFKEKLPFCPFQKRNLALKVYHLKK